MFNDINTILFSTDLSHNCVPAFDATVILAMKFNAKIVLLHVMESLPNYVEGRLKGLLGDDYWEEMTRSHEKDVRQKLIGKRSSSRLIQRALELFCTEAGLDDEDGGPQAREVVIGDGDIGESILENSKTHACDLIVMGTGEGHLLRKSIGGITKFVLNKSKIPVLIVPADPNVVIGGGGVSSWKR